MINRAKAKGTSFETAIVNWLMSRGIYAKRKVLAGNMDEGDIDVGMPPKLVIEAKCVRSWAAGQWVDEATVEAENSGMPCIVVAKRIGKGDPGEAFVIMKASQFFQWFKLR